MNFSLATAKLRDLNQNQVAMLLKLVAGRTTKVGIARRFARMATYQWYIFEDCPPYSWYNFAGDETKNLVTILHPTNDRSHREIWYSYVYCVPEFPPYVLDDMATTNICARDI